MWNITNRWRWSVLACQNKTRQWDQLWTTKCGEEDKEEGENWTNGVSQPEKRSVWRWFVTTEGKICVISNNANTIIITCTERWVFQTFPTISTRAWLHWNLIHTSAVCLKFPHQWASYMYCAVIIISEYNLSCVHPGAFLQLTDDINTCFLIPTFRYTFF